MELFSVPCITCRAKLKVRHVSAIGQILACPRCGAMVQIQPPAGWKPPPPAAKPKAVSPPVPAPAQPSAAEPAAAPGAMYIAEPAESEPLASDLFAPAPHEHRLRRRILLGGGLAAAAIIGFGLWSSLGERDDDEQRSSAGEQAAAPSASAGSAAVDPAKPTTTVAAAPALLTSASATPAASGTVPPVSPAATASSTTAPAAQTSATPVSTAPLVVAMAGASSTAPAGTVPQPATLPTAKPAATAPSPAPAVAPAADNIDVAARLAAPAAGLRFEQTKRKAALDVVAQLAGVAVDYDWDALAPRDAGLTELVSTAEAATLKDVLEQLLAPRLLRYSTLGGRITVAGAAGDPAATSVDYPIGDLIGDDAAQAAALGQLVRTFVAPDSWEAAGGAASLEAVADKLTVVQKPAAQREAAAFVAQLRAARNKQSSSTTPLATRYAAARAKLETPVTMNFRPAAPLAQVVERLEAAAGVTISIDHGALAEQGVAADTTVGIAADKHPLAQVLTALCDPRGWAWRVVDEQTIELTTRDALRRRLYVEFYDLRTPPADGATPEQRLARLKLQTADAGWSDSGGAGVMTYDAPSGFLIVRQHQAGQFRLEQLLNEAAAGDVPRAANPKPAGTSPSASPSSAAAAPAARTSPPPELAPVRTTP